MERKRGPDLVTVGVDLNVKNLAVITVRQHDQIIQTVFLTDHGLDQARYRHLKRIAKKQHLSGRAVKGEGSNRYLWRHIRRMNEDAAHKVARQIARVCARYPGCVLLFERLRSIKQRGGSTSRRMNRKQANQLRGKINQYAKDKAYEQGIVTVEVNPHGTSQYCSRCGAKGERFSSRGGAWMKAKGEKCFDVLSVTRKPMPITMHQKTCTTRSIRNGIGKRRKRHRKQPQAAEMAAHALSGHTRVGEAWGGQSR